MNAALKYSRLELEQTDTASVKGIGSEVTIDAANQLSVRPFSSSKQTIFKRSSSALTKYFIGNVGKINIIETANDQFRIREVDDVISLKSTFSDYKIEQLNNSARFRCRSGDVKIARIEAGFRFVDIENMTSNIELGIKNTPNYLLNLYKNKYSEYAELSSLSLLQKEEDWREIYLQGNREKAGEIQVRCESCKVTFN